MSLSPPCFTFLNVSLVNRVLIICEALEAFHIVLMSTCAYVPWSLFLLDTGRRICAA